LNLGSSVHAIATRFLIGSDGASSRVAQDLQLDLNRDWIVGVENVYEDVVFDGPPTLLCFVDPKLAPGYIAWIAYDGEQTHVGVGGYANRFDPVKSLAEFQARMRDKVDLTRCKPVERRGGRIPVGGVLSNIANQKGLLIGDAAGAVSPLTAGGLDPCMRLSTFAAKVTSDFLESANPGVLKNYSGELFRSRFISRIWARRIAAQIHSPVLIEIGCASLRLPLLNKLAAHVFFGRGSFPDVEVKLSPETQTS
jgi:flavin-dependent dehydrogenase